MLLHKVISDHEYIFKQQAFHKEIMYNEFIYRINKYYPLVSIDESKFDIEIVYSTTPFVIEKQRVCNINLSDSLMAELEEYYPEAVL